METVRLTERALLSKVKLLPLPFSFSEYRSRSRRYRCLDPANEMDSIRLDHFHFTL